MLFTANQSFIYPAFRTHHSKAHLMIIRRTLKTQCDLLYTHELFLEENGYFVLASCTTEKALSSNISGEAAFMQAWIIKVRIIYSANWKGIIIAHELTI